MIVTSRSLLLSCGSLILMTLPEICRISLIFCPPLPMMAPTMSLGMYICCVRGSAGHTGLQWLAMGRSVRLGTAVAGSHVRRHLGSVGPSCLGAVMHGHGLGWLRGLWMAVRLGIATVGRLHAGSGVRAPAIVLAAPVVASGRLREIGHDLHAARHDPHRPATPGCIRRGGRATKPLVQLLEKGAADIIGGNVDRIGHAHNHQRPLRGQRQARVRGVETSTRGFLNLLDPGTALANYRADEDVGNQQPKRIGFGVRV